MININTYLTIAGPLIVMLIEAERLGHLKGNKSKVTAPDEKGKRQTGRENAKGAPAWPWHSQAGGAEAAPACIH